ncbi:hypothetical protein EYC84_009550 [Monilinia fructicola]|uniref:Uncharacterized protein n=1 Tax=Monilinia fructicola TaxID=38448 RepID=A0A5M9JA99_MONFR|nr:hypothetical protein EYC84_009550 [Monilinia fructicola]
MQSRYTMMDPSSPMSRYSRTGVYSRKLYKMGLGFFTWLFLIPSHFLRIHLSQWRLARFVWLHFLAPKYLFTETESGMGEPLCTICFLLVLIQASNHSNIVLL